MRYSHVVFDIDGTLIDSTSAILDGLQDHARGIYTSVVTCQADLEDQPQSTADGYLRLHLLSHRLVLPNTINLDGLFSRMPNVVWTTAGPCADPVSTRIRPPAERCARAPAAITR